MAVGDLYCGDNDLPAGEFITIQPAAGRECIVRNIYHEAEISIIRVGAAGEFEIANPTDDPHLCGGAGMIIAFGFCVNNTYYLKVKNENAGTKQISFDGFETHIAD